MRLTEQQKEGNRIAMKFVIIPTLLVVVPCLAYLAIEIKTRVDNGTYNPPSLIRK